MKINTCYTVALKSQLPVIKDKKTMRFSDPVRVDSDLIKHTSDLCLKALRFCVDVVLNEWDILCGLKSLCSKRRRVDELIHSTKDNTAKYTQFDVDFLNMPSYMRRAVIADAFGIVSSYLSNHKNWEVLPVSERDSEPVLGLPEHYELTFYEQERDFKDLDKGILGLKFYNGKTWDWYYFHIKPSDAKYIYRLTQTRKLLSPVVEQKGNRYYVRFCFEEKKDLVSPDLLEHRVLAVDLGINAPASWCVMTSDGSVHAKGVIRLSGDEGRLSHAINRKRMYQQAGKKSKCVYRWVKDANKTLSINTVRELMRIAVLYDVDCIVFEYLDRAGKKRGSHKYRERIHMWRALDVQKRVELQAHRMGMRISRVCAWNTSKLAFDGSGQVTRNADNYSICRFPSGKIYNCDLSAAQNIGARYFLRAYKNAGIEGLPPAVQSTLYTLKTTVSMLQTAA